VPDDVTIEYTKGEEEEDDEDAHSLSAWECLKAGRLKNITQRVVSSPAGGLAGVCFTSKLVSITRGEHIAWELLAQDGASLTLIGPCGTNARTEVRLSDLLDSDTSALTGTAVALGYHFSRVRGRHCSLFYSPDATEQFKASLSRCGETCDSSTCSSPPECPDGLNHSQYRVTYSSLSDRIGVCNPCVTLCAHVAGTSGMRRRGFRHIPAPADRTRLQA